MNRFGFTLNDAHGRVPGPYAPLQDEPHEVTAVHARKNTKTVLVPQIQSMKDYILKHCKKLIYRTLNQVQYARGRAPSGCVCPASAVRL